MKPEDAGESGGRGGDRDGCTDGERSRRGGGVDRPCPLRRAIGGRPGGDPRAVGAAADLCRLRDRTASAATLSARALLVRRERSRGGIGDPFRRWVGRRDVYTRRSGGRR